MINRLRALRRSDDGQSLIFVLLIGVLTMLMLGTASVALVSQIGPSGASVDSGAALAAAEAGIDDFVATVNRRCPPTDGFYCGWLTTGVTSDGSVADPTNDVGTLVAGSDGTGTRESFYWKVAFATSGFARVVSTGQVPTGKASPKYRTKTLVADVDATPSFNNFQYYTKYETYPADFVNSFFAPRTVQVTSSSAASGSAVSGPGLLTWNGTCTYVSTTATPTCDPNHDTSICNDLYYPSDGPGRGTDVKWNNAVRRPSAAVQAAMGTDSSFAYYAETGTFQPTSGPPVAEVHNDTCDSSFEPNMVMSGPIYSQDAYLIDRGKDTGNSQNSMPVFNDYAYSMWNGVINGVQQPLDVNGGYDRPYPTTDGQISTTLNPAPVYTTRELDLPSDDSDAKGLATCTYTGPTRIKISGAFAYITSPGTPTAPSPPGAAYCYQSTGSFAGVGGGGVVNAQVPIQDTLIYVQNPASGSPSLATAADPIFDLTTTLSVPPDTSGNTLAGTWTDDATYSSNAPCPAADPTERRNLDCEASNANPAADVFTAIKNAVNGVVAGSDADGAVQSDLQSAMGAAFTKPGVLVSSKPSSLGAGQVRYQVTAGAMTSASTTITPAAQSDAFFQSTTGAGYKETDKRWPVSITRYSCTNAGGCSTANSITSTAMLTGASNATRTTYTALSPVNSTSRFPWFGSGGYTDMNNDITQYYNGYGDAYVEGTLTGSMSIVAEHDIVITNNLDYNNENLTTTTDGLALVANHDVRIYRPMTCTDNGTAGQTTGGYCPNDLTGVYTTPLSWPLPNNYPSLKYQRDNAPAMGDNATIYATIFTLQGCFMVDNFYRGGIGSSAAIYGGLYQQHRGPTSLPYQGRPYQGSTTKMPGITLSYTYDNMRAGQTANGGLRVPWFPTPQGQPPSGRTWDVFSISTATGAEQP